MMRQANKEARPASLVQAFPNDLQEGPQLQRASSVEHDQLEVLRLFDEEHGHFEQNGLASLDPEG